MSAAYSEKEREFLESLEDDTGLDLAAWMAAISAQGLGHRNDIIDWLRQRGFMFSKASWLERIHHNGGKPIYLDRVPPNVAAPKRVKPAEEAVPAAIESEPALPPQPAAQPEPAIAAPVAAPRPTPQPAPTAPSVPQPSEPQPRAAKPGDGDPAALDDLLSKAKAYRPLAQYLLAEISRTVPDVEFIAEGAYIEIIGGRPLGVIGISPRELRLALELGDPPADGAWKPAKFPPPAPRTSANLTHMLILTDARQVNADLLGLVRSAASRPV